MRQAFLDECVVEPPRRVITDTSRLAFDDIHADVKAMDLRMALRLDHYLRATGHPDATAGELAENLGLPITSVRPRLTGALKAKALTKGPIRKARVEAKHCRGYLLAVPRQAIERALRQAKVSQ